MMRNSSNHHHHQQQQAPVDVSASSSPTGMSPLPHAVVLDRLQAMIYQESQGYDYNSCFPALPVQDITSDWQPLKHEWREKICQWTYNVVDTYDLPREIVALSLNYFDRYLATRGNQCNGTLALLVSLTTLHIAMKLHSLSSGTFQLKKLADLSRGQFGPAHIEQMEWQIMSALQFKLHPPTLFAFLSYFLMLLPQQQPEKNGHGSTNPNHAVRKELFEVAIYMAELSVCDSFLVPYPSSLIALASLAIVMEGMPSSKLSNQCKQLLWDEIIEVLGLAGSSRRTMLLQEAKDRLWHIFQSTKTSSSSSSSSSQQASDNHHVHSGTGIHSANASLTSSPTSAADMMAMEDWNDAEMDCDGVDHYHHHHRMTSIQHPDTDDEGEEATCFRYSPSPPSNNHSHSIGHKDKSYSSSSKLYRFFQQPQHHPHLEQPYHPQQNRRSINSSSPKLFLNTSRHLHASNTVSRARLACSPIVATVQ